MLIKSTITLIVAASCLTGCNMLGNKVRGSMGMAPVKVANLEVVNNGFKTICKMHVADADGQYVEPNSLIAMEYDDLQSGKHHRFEVMIHDKPLKVRFKACDGTVLKEQTNVAVAESSTVQIMVP